MEEMMRVMVVTVIEIPPVSLWNNRKSLLEYMFVLSVACPHGLARCLVCYLYLILVDFQ